MSDKLCPRQVVRFPSRFDIPLQTFLDGGKACFDIDLELFRRRPRVRQDVSRPVIREGRKNPAGNRSGTLGGGDGICWPKLKSACALYKRNGEIDPTVRMPGCAVNMDSTK